VAIMAVDVRDVARFGLILKASNKNLAVNS
jgi:hypothetical protein